MYRMEPKTKKVEKEKTKNEKDMLRSIGVQPEKSTLKKKATEGKICGKGRF